MAKHKKLHADPQHTHKAGCGDAYVWPSIGGYRETGGSQGSLISQASLNAQYPGLEKDHFPKKLGRGACQMAWWVQALS